MKNLFWFLILFALSSNAQKDTISKSIKDKARFDEVIMVNGEVKTGTITEVGEDYIKFIHAGESLNYNLKKSTISKIEFSSGRIEVLNKLITNQNSGNVNFSNKVAVLPFSYISDAGDKKIESMEYEIQNESYLLLSKNATGLEIQDPMATNALLIKNGITRENYKGYTMPEIAEILGIEYIVVGSVKIEKTNSTINSSQNTYSQNGVSKKGYTGTSSVTSVNQNYKTNVDLFIYNNEGKKIFGDSRNSFWASTDAYKATIKYLLKKSPLWAK